MADEGGEDDTVPKRKNLLENLNFVVALIGLVVAFVAFWIPIRMDRDARDRDRSRTCVEAVIDLRSALTALERGYQVDPDDTPQRLADWDAGGGQIERVRVSCLGVSLSSAKSVQDADPLWEQYDTERTDAREKKPSLGVLGALRDWTIAVISDLTRG